MADPFPSIDPYVEDQNYWEDFHTRFLAYACDTINDRLPDGYDAELEERFTIASFRGDVDLRGDMTDSRDEFVPVGLARAANLGGVAEPVVIPLPTPIAEEVVERRLEVRRREDRSVVAVIELLSPTNKIGKGWYDYVARRELIVAEPVHLIELDFLIGGRRLPMGRPLPAGNFFAFVSRADRRPDSEVYTWSIRSALPEIPIPLDAPTPDVLLELAPLYETAHERGRYSRKVRRDRPLGVPLATEDLGWVSSLIRGV